MTGARDVVRADGTVVRRKPVVGDMRWDGELWRRWSGRRWARAVHSLHPERLTSGVRVDAHAEDEEAARRRALVVAAEHQVANRGATVVFDGPAGIVLAYRARASPLSMLLLGVLTVGLAPLLWTLALSRSEDRIRLEVDAWGNVWARTVRSP